jgi:hypothetical protein
MEDYNNNECIDIPLEKLMSAYNLNIAEERKEIQSH